MRVDRGSRSPTCWSGTGLTSLPPSVATGPKNCNPKQGARSSAIAAASLLEHHARTEGVVERLRSPSPGMERAGDEFPERLEVLENGRVGVVVVGGRIVHVGGQPDDVADARVLVEG